MGTVKTELNGVRTTIIDAFQSVEDALAALHLDQLQGELEAGVQQIAQAVQAARLEAVFSTATDVTGGAADVVGAVPLSIRPDDVKQEFPDAAAPIKARRIDTAVRTVLVGQL